MLRKSSGLSLVEIMIAIVLTGVLAVLTFPKFVASQEEAFNTQVGQVDQLQQMIVMALQNYENVTGQSIDLNSTSYERIFYNYGSFMAYKRISDTHNYFLLSDGSRLTQSAVLFSKDITHAKFPEYAGTSGLDDREWGPPPNQRYCGMYDSKECLYIDVNGRMPPNKIGKTGDIIPFRIDPETLRIKTLYQWHYEEHLDAMDPPVRICNFISSYDMETGAPGISFCWENS